MKEQTRDRRLRAIDPEVLHALQHAAQTFRHWRTSLGMVAFAGELPPEVGVPIMNRLDAETARLWQKARREANRKQNPDDAAKAISSLGSAVLKPERRSAIAADAFVRLVETGGKGKSQTADLVIVCDLRAYRRGHADDGEPCHIIGGGPVPVSLARERGRDAFLKAVIHDGVRIDTIAHFGRRYPAVLRTALMLGAPPEFEGNSAPRLVVTGATTSKETTSTPWSTEARPLSTTSARSAGPTTASRLNETTRPGSSAPNRGVPTKPPTVQNLAGRLPRSAVLPDRSLTTPYGPGAHARCVRRKAGGEGQAAAAERSLDVDFSSGG